MAKNPITASERRGIIVVAALALLITGAGLWMSRCGRPETTVTPEEVKILLDGTSQTGTDGNYGINDKKSKKNKRDKETRRKKGKEIKSYRKRSLLDEPVSSD